jgi:hypothetical protein
VKVVSICAVYRGRPLQLVVQIEDGDFLELSQEDLKEGDFEFDDKAWKQLVEDYRIFQPSYR